MRRPLCRVVNAPQMFNALGHILYTPEAEIRKDVEAARARIRKKGSRDWPPQTSDENLVSLYEAIKGTE